MQASKQATLGPQLLLGRWQEVLPDVEYDAVITDPPYLGAKRCGAGNWAGPSTRVEKNEFVMKYSGAKEEDLQALVEMCRARCRGWVVVFNDFAGARFLVDAFRAARAVVSEPIAWAKPPALTARRGALVLPEKGTEFIVCARFSKMRKWHTLLPGHYVSPRNTAGPVHSLLVTGGKPLPLMREIVSHYSAPRQLVCDPFAGGGTTLLAAALEGRRAIGAEADPATHARAVARLVK